MTVREEGGVAIRERLQALARPDFAPLLETIARRMEAGAKRDREAGMGRDGPFDPIKASTEKRRAEQGRGSGPPLLADETSKFANLATTITPNPSGGLVVGEWPGTEAFIKAHIEGIPGRMVARDPVFISAETWAEIRQDIRDFYMGIILGGPGGNARVSA